MENKKQTALDWLKDMLIDNKYLSKDAEHLFKCAKTMEKDQMKDFVTTFLSSASPAVNSFIRDEFEKYYNETYDL